MEVPQTVLQDMVSFGLINLLVNVQHALEMPGKLLKHLELMLYHLPGVVLIVELD